MNDEMQGMGQPQIEPNAEPPQYTEQPQEDAGIYHAPDVYESQSSQDIYRTPEPDVTYESSGGMFSGSQPDNDSWNSYGNADSAATQNPYENTGNNTYIDSQYTYGNNSNNGNNTYIDSQYTYGNNSNNGNNTYIDSQYTYGNTGNAGYYTNNGNFTGQNPYYGNNNMGGSQNPYGNNGMGGSQNPYGNNNMGGAQNPYGNNYGAGPYGYDPQYSPYAVPQKKKSTGLIVGIIITVVLLFVIALFFFLYRAFELISARNEEGYRDRYGNHYDWSDPKEEYAQDYDYEYDFDDYFDDDYYYDYDDYDDFEDYFREHYDQEDDYDYDADEYYTLHNDIKTDLSYSVNMESYDYTGDSENVMIYVEYPVVEGENIPNLDKINETIHKEIDVITDYYEEEYADYMYDDSYFYADATGYVTYMNEEVLSIVFDERIYSDYYNYATLYCINVDMKDGVILDNVNLISVNDDFSVDFRYRSDEQNGSISSLDRMTDQEITRHLTSEDDLIIFYTPQGMEIGLNYSDGWVTVTYHDYQDFLKIF